MLPIVLYIALQLSALGLTWIAMYGTIFSPVRNWVTSKFRFFRELLQCAKCTGFWAGLLHAVPMLIMILNRDFDATKLQHLLAALAVYTFPLQTAAFAFISEIVVEFIISAKLFIEAKTKTEQLRYLAEVSTTMSAYEKLIPPTDDTSTTPSTIST